LFLRRHHLDNLGHDGVPPSKSLPLLGTESVEQFGFSGTSHPVGRDGGTHLPARTWAGQAKTGGPGCRTAGVRPVRGGPREHGRGPSTVPVQTYTAVNLGP